MSEAAWQAALEAAARAASEQAGVDRDAAERLAWRAVFAVSHRLLATVPDAAIDAVRDVVGGEPLREDRIDALLDDRAGDTAARRRRGAFFTPAGLARDLADRLPLEEARRVIDPACGSGALLVAAYDAMVAAGRAPGDALAALAGRDIHAGAVEAARLRLHARAGRLADALLAPLDDSAWQVGDTLAVLPESDAADVVIANPPFGNAIRSATARTDDERDRYAALYPEAATGAYDRAGLFVEWSVRAARRAAGIVVPRALLGAPYAARLRGWVEERLPLRELVTVEDHDAFEGAAVFVAGLVLGGDATEGERGTSAGEVASSWAVRASPWAGTAALATEIADGGTLSDLVDVSASCAVGEAYAWRDALVDDAGGDGFRLVTSGAIDPFEVRWGQQPQRYLKRRWQHPVVPAEALSPRRQAQASQPKVLLPGLSAVLEAAVAGCEYVGAVATLSLTPRGDHAGATGALLAAVALYLNTPLARGWFLAHYGAAGLSGGSVQVTKNKLAGLPVPRWLAALPAPCETSAAELLELARTLPSLPVTHPAPPDWVNRATEVRRAWSGDAAAALSALSQRRAPDSEGRMAAATLALMPAG